MCWFLRRGENRSTRRKTSRSKDENQQQTQPTYDTGTGSRTRATLVGGERSHHCAIPAPPRHTCVCLSGFYLGYLRGRGFPQNDQLPFPPPPKKKYCYHYSIEVTISEKSSRRDEVSAHEVSIPSLRTLYDKEHGVLQI